VEGQARLFCEVERWSGKPVRASPLRGRQKRLEVWRGQSGCPSSSVV